MSGDDSCPSSTVNEPEPENAAADAASDSVVAPNRRKVAEQDIVLGRGIAVRDHPGNVRFRKMVQDQKADYDMLPRRSPQTRVIATEIVQAILNSGGRFLRSTKCGDQGDITRDIIESGNWRQVDKKTAITKTLQLFRDLSKLDSELTETHPSRLRPQSQDPVRKRRKRVLAPDSSSDESSFYSEGSDEEDDDASDYWSQGSDQEGAQESSPLPEIQQGSDMISTEEAAVGATDSHTIGVSHQQSSLLQATRPSAHSLEPSSFQIVTSPLTRRAPMDQSQPQATEHLSPAEAVMQNQVAEISRETTQQQVASASPMPNASPPPPAQDPRLLSMQPSDPLNPWNVPNPLIRQRSTGASLEIEPTTRLVYPGESSTGRMKAPIHHQQHHQQHQHHQQQQRAQAMNQQSESSLFLLSPVELDIIRGVGIRGLPVWTRGRVNESFFTGMVSGSSSTRFDWRDLSLGCNSLRHPTAASSADSLRGSQHPRHFAVRTIMLLEKVLMFANQGLVLPTHDVSTVMSWFSDELARWAHTVDMVDDFRPGGRPMAYSASDTHAAKTNSSGDNDRIALVYKLDQTSCHNVIRMAAHLSRLRCLAERYDIKSLIKDVNRSHLLGVLGGSLADLAKMVESDTRLVSAFLREGYVATLARVKNTNALHRKLLEKRFEWLVGQMHSRVG